VYPPTGAEGDEPEQAQDADERATPGPEQEAHVQLPDGVGHRVTPVPQWSLSEHHPIPRVHEELPESGAFFDAHEAGGAVRLGSVDAEDSSPGCMVECARDHGVRLPHRLIRSRCVDAEAWCREPVDFASTHQEPTRDRHEREP
jgi:hypothetical protein